MAGPVGTTLGRYRLDAALGRGGMAEVYRATDSKLGRAVAVKVVLPFFATQPQFVERFLREARLIAALEHPHVLPIYDVGEHQGVPFLVMPYMEGGTLVERMNGQPQPLWRVAAWIRQLAEALDAAHQAGVLHRDVKPANVLVGRGDRLMLADFGIAKMAESATRLTATGMVVGTPAYMAPELAQGEAASAASDIYALGVLAYELVTGRPPFEGDSALSLLHQHVHAPPPRPTTRVASLPPALDEIFAEVLAKRPGSRPASCRAFAAALAAAIPAAEREAAATLAEAPLPTPTSGATLRLAPASAPGVAAAPPVPAPPGSAQGGGRRGLARVAAWSAAAVVAVAGGLGVLLRDGGGAAPGPRPVPAAETHSAPPSAERPAGAEMPPAVTAGSLAPAPAPPPAAEMLPTPSDEPPLSPPASPSSPMPPTATQVPPASPAEAPAGSRRPVLDSLRPRPGRRSGASLPASGAETLGRARLRRALGKRPTEEDFRQLAAAAAQGLARQPGQAQFEALAAWASGGLAYLAGRDAESRQALARSLAHGDLPAALELGPLVPQRRSAGGEIADWELALAYGDARGEAGALIETALARHPGEASLLLGRALVRHLDGRHLEAASEVAALLERPETVVQRARLTLLLAEEHGHAGRWDEARRLLADACSQGSRLACQERDRLAGRAPR